MSNVKCRSICAHARSAGRVRAVDPVDRLPGDAVDVVAPRVDRDRRRRQAGSPAGCRCERADVVEPLHEHARVASRAPSADDVLTSPVNGCAVRDRVRCRSGSPSRSQLAPCSSSCCRCVQPRVAVVGREEVTAVRSRSRRGSPARRRSCVNASPQHGQEDLVVHHVRAVGGPAVVARAHERRLVFLRRENGARARC